MKCDVAIVGGGPSGTTAGTLLRRYAPDLDVAILERERFPRDHVGESQLPAISDILNEMGAWDAVEAAGFPIKIGGTYRWGRTDELWDFEFLPGDRFLDEPRPARFAGQRRQTAFQVDRSAYDKILLDHARERGCRIFEGARVVGVERDGDRVAGLRLEDGTSLEARYYVDASGDSGLLRRAMGVEVDSPTALRNIAVWDYWQDAAWAVSLGVGGTRIQVLSLGWGWLWFIPISPTRTSVGLVVPAAHFKATGLTTEAIYLKAVAEEPLIASLLRHARREGGVQATRDWSFVAERLAGENWFLAGDSCGFADPILSAGMTLAHTSGRKVAYTIAETERGKADPGWLRSEYDRGHRGQIRHHIQFADYWYSANGRFTDLKDYCSEIARTAGLELDADAAFRWLAAGGFALEEPGVARALSYRVGGIKFIAQHFGGDRASWAVARHNRFRLVLSGARKERHATYRNGRVLAVESYRRGESSLPLVGVYAHVVAALTVESDVHALLKHCVNGLVRGGLYPDPATAQALTVEALEALVAEGWVRAETNPKRPFLTLDVPEESAAMHPNRDNVMEGEAAGR